MSSNPMNAKNTSAAPDKTPLAEAPSTTERSPTCEAPDAITSTNPPICSAASATESQIERSIPAITIAVSTKSSAIELMRGSTSAKYWRYCANPIDTAAAATMYATIIIQPAMNPKNSLNARLPYSYSAAAEGNMPVNSA